MGERRRLKRYPLNGRKATFSNREGTWDYSLLDISRGGVFMQSDNYQEPGTFLTMTLGLLDVRMEVLRCQEVPEVAGTYRMGCMFADQVNQELFWELVTHELDIHPEGDDYETIPDDEEGG